MPLLELVDVTFVLAFGLRRFLLVEALEELGLELLLILRPRLLL